MLRSFIARSAWRWAVSTAMLVVLAAALAVPAQAGGYGKAKKIGKAHAPSCDGGFFSANGKCWKCPGGYKHVVWRPAGDAKSCKKAGKTKTRKGKYVGKASLSPTKGVYCKKGRYSVASNRCYTCPKGWKNRSWKKGSDGKFCYRKSRDKYTKAVRQKGDIMCDKGMFALADGGNCWQCPKSHPIRTAWGMTSKKACRTENCGGGNEPICSILKGDKLCKRGLTPNYAIGECVDLGVKEAACKASIATLRGGVKAMGAVLGTFKEVVKKTDSAHVDFDALFQTLIKNIDKRREYAAVSRVAEAALAKSDALSGLFDPDRICKKGAAHLDARLVEILGFNPSRALNKKKARLFDANPMVSTAFAATRDYWAFSLGVAAHKAIGGAFALSYVTDFGGHGGTFISIGPEIATNIDVGGSVGVQFFNDSRLADFAGWGWDGGGSGGPAVSGGIDLSLSGDFKMQGWGVSAGLGIGVLPVDVSFGGTQTWRLD